MRFSVCICTRNRPDDLRKALKSLELSYVEVHEVIVSDDSTDLCTQELIQYHYPNIKYLTGPKRGLSANRNHAIQAITGDYVLFMDDDVQLANDFFSKIRSVANGTGEIHFNKPIITGLENNNGSIIYPHDQSFLGYQNKKYKEGEALKTIVINSTVFPTALFKVLLFDEQLVYGYEEVDIATRAVQEGYQILLAEGAINDHYPSRINRDFYQPYLEKSRVYVTFKRYGFTERKWLKALSFFMIAVVHTMLHGIKVERSKGLIQSFQTVGGSFQYILTHRRNKAGMK
jgi:glycosyltransferase involved in cell wall biosynthesis